MASLLQVTRTAALCSGSAVRRFSAVSSHHLGSCWIRPAAGSQHLGTTPLPPSLGSARRLHNVLDVQKTFSDYEHEKRTFRWQVPHKFNFARDIFDVWAAAELTEERSTSNPALWWVDDKGHEKTFSFQTLAQLSRKVSNILTGPCQLSQGDCAIVVLPKIPEWWMVTLGCIRSGVVNSPGTTSLRAGDIKHRLLTSKAKCIISDSSTVEPVEKVCDECPDLKHKIFVGPRSETRSGWLNFDDLMEKSSDSFQTADTLAAGPMSLFFTSGTTGGPKMTEHSHASYGLGHLNTARYLLMAGPEDVVWNISDTGWAKCAWSSFFAPWLHGACIFIQHSAKFDPDETLRTLRKYPVNSFCMPPTAARVMVKHGLTNFSSKSLRHTICGGEPVNPELIEEWHRGTGLQIFEAYGQTETTLLCGRNPCLEYRPGSMGKSAPGVDLQVVDNEGTPLEIGQEGVLGVRYRPHRPVGLFTCYKDNPLKTQAAFQGDFYLTGDRGVIDEDGYVYFVGRDDDVITSAGYRIGPFEVESALIEHPAVLESAVVSSPDETRGEIVKAFVTLTQQAFEAGNLEKLKVELQEHTKSVTAPYKYPRKIEFVGELPKTISGKIRRVELRELEWSKKKK